MRSVEWNVETAGRHVMDLTDRVAGLLREAGADEGLVHLWLPHATAGICVVEMGIAVTALVDGLVLQRDFVTSLVRA